MISGKILRDAIISGANNINNQRSRVDELNVFPVPDGDTGTNMGMTVGAAVRELEALDDSCTVGEAAKTAASAMLRGARGNSGVITSLLFRGFSKALEGKKEADAADIVAALQKGVEGAYKAVMKPTEGTILTVARVASEEAAASDAADVPALWDVVLTAGQKALDDTPNLLPVLKKAGVVDAGGMGFMTILKAMLASLRGEVTAPVSAAKPKTPVEEKTAFEVFDTEDITFAFDTVYIVRKNDPDVDLDPLRAYLNSIGDSLVIGEDDESFKVHVHTNIPGDALNESQKYGTLELAKIENMRTQHDDILAGKKAQTTDDLEQIEAELEAAEHEEKIAAPEKEYGVVAVCAGAGMEALFQELGADAIVTGGQTMNPSTNDILKEINRTPASTVFVFPNNKNIIMAAEQCVPLTEKKVVVMPTKTVPQGISALLNFNPENSEEQLEADMKEAISHVHTAMVTYAARDSDFDGHIIHAGEYLALMDGALLGSYTNIKTLFKELSWAFDEIAPEFITVYYGKDVQEDDAQEAAKTIIDCFPDAEVSVVSGGQPVYYYMISVE